MGVLDTGKQYIPMYIIYLKIFLAFQKLGFKNQFKNSSYF